MPKKTITKLDTKPKLISRVVVVKGENGYTPVKGVDYNDGVDGKTPTEEELVSLIKPLIPEPTKIDIPKTFSKSQIKKIIDESIKKEIPDVMSKLQGKGNVIVEGAEEGYNLVIDGIKHFVPNAVYGPKLRNFIQLGDSPGTYAGGAGKFLTVNSTETGIEFTDGGGSGGGDTTVSINLTNAQLLTLSSSPVTVVAAQGANTVIQVLTVFICLNNSAGLYTGGGSMNLTIGNVTTIGATFSATFFTADASVGKAKYQPGNNVLGTSACVNQPLLVNTALDFGGGNVANKATLTVTYRVMSTLPA